MCPVNEVWPAHTPDFPLCAEVQLLSETTPVYGCPGGQMAAEAEPIPLERAVAEWHRQTKVLRPARGAARGRQEAAEHGQETWRLEVRCFPASLPRGCPAACTGC